MRSPPLILVVDDVPDNVDILQMRLEAQGYEVTTAADGVEALDKIRELLPDLVLLDVMMPRLDGIETVKRLKADPSLPFIPVILVTAKADGKDVVDGLESGGDDYLTKPVDHAALSARVRAMLRIKALHDTVQDQAKRLEDQAAQLAMWNSTLEERVADARKLYDATEFKEAADLLRQATMIDPQDENAQLFLRLVINTIAARDY